MKIKKKICIECGNETYIFSKGRCRFCATKNSKINKISKKGLEKKEKKKEYTKKQWELFLEIWDEREHYCYETGKYLGKEPLSTMFHHILPKSKYPEYSLLKENIVLLHPDIHAQVEVDISKCPKVAELTIQLKKKYLHL